jgi:hypothetical protein
MKKLKLMLNKVLAFFKIKKVKEKKESNEIITSIPYVVKIENTTDIAIENVSLFFANNQNQLLFNENGDYVKNGLIISSAISTVSYRQISNQLAIEKKIIGLMCIQSENNKQVIEKFNIEQNDANGNFASKTVSPHIDAYQQQQNIALIKVNYSLNGKTSILLHKVYPKTILMIYFYPDEISNKFKNK